LRASILEISPLLRCSSLPPRHAACRAGHAQHRAAVVARFLRGLDSQDASSNGVPSANFSSHHVPQMPEVHPYQAPVGCSSNNNSCAPSLCTAAVDPKVAWGRHPVGPLSLAADEEFLHTPFDVAETRVCIGEQQAAVRWNRC
jgi:hypothetical protein